MIFKGKPTFDNLDFYLARKEYDLALAAILQELKRQPRNSNLVLRQAEVMILMGDREGAIELYRTLAEDYTRQGFYARAIAVANKILRLDPSRTKVTSEVAQLISSHQAADQAAREKLTRAAQPGREAAAGSESASRTPQPRYEAGAQPGRSEEATDKEADSDLRAPTRGASPIAAGPAESQEERERTASQLFGVLPHAALEKLLSLTSVRSFVPGEVIVHEGEPGTSLFLITEGRVDVKTSDPIGLEIRLATLGPGDFFGEVSVLTGRPRTATIVALEPVVVIEIGREVLRGIVGEHPDVEGILRAFYERRAQATVDAMVARLRGQDG
jgi:hypothetical protein